jgi:hypothetical protein
LAQLSPANGELPKSSRDFLDDSPKRVYSLLLETKNLHVESAFELVKGQEDGEGRTDEAQQYGLGPLKTEQLEKQQQSAEVVTVSPET